METRQLELSPSLLSLFSDWYRVSRDARTALRGSRTARVTPLTVKNARARVRCSVSKCSPALLTYLLMQCSNTSNDRKKGKYLHLRPMLTHQILIELTFFCKHTSRYDKVCHTSPPQWQRSSYPDILRKQTH